MEPPSTDTRLTRTPRYYGQFRLSRREVHMSSIKINPLITDTRQNGQRTLLRVPTDNLRYIIRPALRTALKKQQQ